MFQRSIHRRNNVRIPTQRHLRSRRCFANRQPENSVSDARQALGLEAMVQLTDILRPVAAASGRKIASRISLLNAPDIVRTPLDNLIKSNQSPDKNRESTVRRSCPQETGVNDDAFIDFRSNGSRNCSRSGP